MFVLAQTGDGISCLLVPRRRADGSDNGWTIDRLKTKLGNKSNPTAEVRFDGAQAELVGESGRGVRAIMAMIGGTRQDCVLGSTAVMRTGTIEAIHWAAHRSAFGRRLVDQPAMTAVLADLALETEAATWGAMRLARATEDAAAGDPVAIAFRRLANPVLKFWICKRAPLHAGEALECQGGYGYVEESRLSRSYREAPLMSIWEGSGNVQALDVLRAMQREPDSVGAFLDELDLAAGANRRLDSSVAALRDMIAVGVDEARARELTGPDGQVPAGLAARPVRAGAVADAYCAAQARGRRQRARMSPCGGRRRGDRRAPPGRPMTRVVAIQPALQIGEVDANLARCARLVRAAAKEHSPEAIFLPEAITSPNAYDSRMRSVARPLLGAPLQTLRELARDTGALVGGGLHRGPRQRHQGHLRAVRARRLHPPPRQGPALVLGEQLLLRRHRRRRRGDLARADRAGQRFRVGPRSHREAARRAASSCWPAACTSRRSRPGR